MAGPAAPAMATPLWRSAGNTFSIVRCEIRLPEVARRSPAISTPSAYRMATTVVAWEMSSAAVPDGQRVGRPHALEQLGEGRARVVRGREDRQGHTPARLATVRRNEGRRVRRRYSAAASSSSRIVPELAQPLVAVDAQEARAGAPVAWS